MIPKRIQIHWFWDKPSGNLPIWVSNSIEAYKTMMPDWDVRVYTELPADLPKKYESAMYKAPHSRFRADLVRWWLLYRDGGIYVDADTLPFQTFDELRDSKTFFPPLTINGYDGPSKPDMYFIGSEPGNELFIDALDNCLDAENGPMPRLWFYVRNVLPDVCDRDIRILPEEYVINASCEQTKRYCRGKKVTIDPGPAYLVHFRNFYNRRKGDIDSLMKEQDDPSFLNPEEDEKETKKEPDPVFHELPNGDLVADPGKSLPDTPKGFVRDKNNSYRFHKNRKDSPDYASKNRVSKQKNPDEKKDLPDQDNPPCQYAEWKMERPCCGDKWLCQNEQSDNYGLVLSGNDCQRCEDKSR